MYDCLPSTSPLHFFGVVSSRPGFVLVQLRILYYDGFGMQRENVEEIRLYSAYVSIYTFALQTTITVSCVTPVEIP